MDLSLWFLFFFIIRHSIGHTLVTIPYDALGQELTSERSERERLFSAKSLSNYMGLLTAYMTQIALAVVVATDISAQARSMAALASGLMVISLLWLLTFIREKDSSGPVNDDSGKVEKTPFVATMYALAKSRPYLNYLMTRLWITFAFHLPFFNRSSYLKYVMGFENAALATTASAFVAQVCSIWFLPICMHFIRRLGKIWTLVSIVSVAAMLYTCFALLPIRVFRSMRMYALQPVVEGFTQTALYTIPEMMLADVIDYDELVNGFRREGIFVVLDVNIMQLMDIVAGVAPGLILSALGYVGNGGCQCGCGVKCPNDYQRWSCPGDVGYACSSALSDRNAPLMGPPDREPPCTSQPQGVIDALQLFFFTIPAFCFMVTIFFAAQAPIQAGTHEAIREQLNLRAKGAKQAFDPVENRRIRDDRASGRLPGAKMLASFSEPEQALVLEVDGTTKLRYRLRIQLAVPLLAITLLGWFLKQNAFPALRSVLISALFMLIMQSVWQTLKLRTLEQGAEELKLLRNAELFEQQQDASSTGLVLGVRRRSRNSRLSHAQDDHPVGFTNGLIGPLGARKSANVRAGLHAWIERVRASRSPEAAAAPAAYHPLGPPAREARLSSSWEAEDL